MSNPAIKVNDVSKMFMLGEMQGYGTLRESIAVAARAATRWRRNGAQRPAGNAEEAKRLWALRDISFEIEPGEVVGIIGRNGAGKSTLLKILSRITEPTNGEVELFGRVASLLEVGTGFHNELTGRENIYLNGSILGMRKKEIDRKFDEIVDFSGVERFLDTPVKRYSSGMKVRLAFSVAAHLEPEILIVDEVLAVGDVEFQRKCMGKMNDVVQSGRTVLFVSHNMAAVENLCSRCILLNEGGLTHAGPSSEVISHYLGAGSQLSGDVSLAGKKGVKTLTRLRILDEAGQAGAQVPLGGSIVFEVHGNTPERIPFVKLSLDIDGELGQRVAVCHTYFQYNEMFDLEGSYILRCSLRNCRLMPGTYNVHLVMQSADRIIEQTGPFAFEVVACDVYGTGKMLPAGAGTYVPEVAWQVSSGEAA